MADAPSPITSPPAQDFQPYDSTDPGQQSPEDGHSYDANGTNWKKIAEAGAANRVTGTIDGGWPSDGASNGGAWKQC